MPGLRLTVRQAARLFGVAPDVAVSVLDELRHASILTRSEDGAYSLMADPTRRKAPSSPCEGLERKERPNGYSPR